jgi:hypothetical protein
MRHRGRKSANELSVVPLWAEHERPAPPEGMPEPEAAIWKATVDAMRPRWFGPECFALLQNYCFTVWLTERLAARIRPEAEPDRDLLQTYDMMTKLMMMLAGKLRLTPKSNRPGVDDGRGSPLRRKLWET